MRTRRQVARPTVEEVTTFLAHVSACGRIGGRQLHGLWRLAATTGLRRGELCGLAWEDIDLDLGLLTVSRSIGVDRGEVFVKEPKSAASRRTIGLDTETVRVLRAIRPTHEEVSWPVFRDPDGSPLHPDSATWRFKAEWRHAALSAGVTLHGLRHSHGSALLLAGMPVTQVAAGLGHDPQVLMSIYAGELDSARRQRAMADVAQSIYS